MVKISRSDIHRHFADRGYPVERMFGEDIGADNLPQGVIHGAERATDAVLAQRRADMPLKPKAIQRPCDVGLFSDDSEQLDLVSWFTEQSED